MKKTLIIIVLLSIVLVVTYVYISQIDTTVRKDIILKNGSLDGNIAESNSLSDSEWLETVNRARSEIKAVIETKEYQKANVDKKIELIDPVLLSLFERGYISGYEYNLDGPAAKVVYTFNGGGSARIFFEEYDR